jgi:SPP1 gp7 family putative phage head morphogenesis protein
MILLQKRETLLPLRAKRPAIAKLRARMTRTVAAFLESQPKEMARQVGLLRMRHLRKAELTDEELNAIETILASVDFAGWTVLAGDVEPIMDEIAKEQAYAALAQVGIDVEARPEVRAIVDARAIAYARDRSAALVGMRRNELGGFVPNPNAEWQIADSTRDFMRADVETAIAEGWSNDRLATAFAESYGFSKDRAMTIARTETNFAASQGALEGYKASGVVEGKLWLTAEDDLVSEECEANADAGVIGLDEDFPSGDDAPPVHPNCRCAIAPVVDFDMPAAAVAAENEGTQ